MSKNDDISHYWEHIDNHSNGNNRNGNGNSYNDNNDNSNNNAKDHDNIDYNDNTSQSNLGVQIMSPPLKNLDCQIPFSSLI